MVTGRLLLRPWCMDDLRDLNRYARDPAVGPNAGWKPHESLEESRAVLETFVGNGDLTAVVLRENGRTVGSIGLHPDRLRHGDAGPCRELGYVLSREYWGRGLMTEAVRRVLSHAFRDMGLAFVSVAHFPGNGRSERVIRKCGFRYEKTLRGSYRDYRGVWLDEICYVLARGDYFARENPGFRVGALTEDMAREICAWRCGGPYAACHSFSFEEVSARGGAIAGAARRESEFRAVLNGSGELCGFFRFSGEEGAVTLSLGIKPELRGLGYGNAVMDLILNEFFIEFPSGRLELEVRAFNRRAIACYRRAGFTEVRRYRKDTPSGADELIRMGLSARDWI